MVNNNAQTIKGKCILAKVCKTADPTHILHKLPIPILQMFRKILWDGLHSQGYIFLERTEVCLKAKFKSVFSSSKIFNDLFFNFIE